MKKRNFIKYSIRFFVAVVIHFLIKLFDATYEGNMFSFDLRGSLFFVFFVAFTLTIWEIADAIQQKALHTVLKNDEPVKQYIFLTVILSVYGLIAAFLFSLSYYLFDLLLFGFHHYGGIPFKFIDLDAYLGMFFGYISILLVNGQIYLFNHWKRDRLFATQLEKENFRARFEALKNQIDPHFLFNSLSVLTTLVYRNQDMAAEYINQLSKIYRYILEKKEEILVPLKDELDHLNSYFFLIKIRFEDHIRLSVLLKEETGNSTYIPPNTLQMLIENAIKHNEFSGEIPLVITITENDNVLIIKNGIRKRRRTEEPSGAGLNNIINRYELLKGGIVEVNENSEDFEILLPKLNPKAYESTYIRR